MPGQETTDEISTTPEPLAQKSRRPLWIAGGAAVGVLLLAIVLVNVFNGASVTVPDQIDGVARIKTGPVADAVNKQLSDSGIGGQQAVAAVYGTSGQPEFLFLASEGSESIDEDRAALQAAAKGLGSGGALGLDTSAITKEELDGVTYSCAPITGSGLSGAACLWNDGDTLGMVFTLSDRGNPAEFASHVHDAVVG